jgi:hypothetical protein
MKHRKSRIFQVSYYRIIPKENINKLLGLYKKTIYTKKISLHILYNL